MSTWKPLAGRISFNADTPPGEKPIASELFRQGWGADAQSFQQPPNPLMPSIAQGIQSGMLATCAVLPNRIDFALAPNVQGAKNDRPTLVTIESVTALYDELTQVAANLRSGSLLVPTPFARPSVYMQFLSPEETLLAGNQRIADVIPTSYRPKLEKEDSFALQLSQSLQVGEITLNALVRWSVETFQVFWFGFQAAAGGSASILPQIEKFLGACVAFDIGPPAPVGISFGPAPTTGAALDRPKQAEIIFTGLQYVDLMQHEYGLGLARHSNVTTTH